MDPIEESLHKMLNEVEKNASLEDAPTLLLIQDIELLLERAKNGLYHDFHKNGADAPKIQLHKDILELDQKMQKGLYDNHS